MATISEILTVDMILNASGYSKGLRTVEKDSQKFASNVNRSADKASKGFVNSFQKMRRNGQRTFARLTRGARGLARAFGSVQVALAGVGIGLAAKELSAAASRFEETESKFQAVFKEGAEEQRALIEAFGSKVGRSTTDLLQFQSTLQDTFVPLGIARKEAAKFSDQVTKLGIDIASFNNKADADVIRDLQSALVGNTETVRKYGIVINQARVNQELLNMGIAGGTKTATEGEKALARLNLIMRGSSDAMGDAVRTANSFENSMKRVRAVVTDASVTFGKELNEQILKTIEEAGGLDTILNIVKLSFKAVTESAKVFVRILGSYAEASGNVLNDSEKLEDALLNVEDVFKNVEIAIRTFLIPFGAFATGVVTVVGGVILLGKTLFFLGEVVLRSVGAGIAKFISFAVKGFGELLEAAATVSRAFGDNFLSKSLQSASSSVKNIGKDIDDFAGSALPSVDEIKAGFKDLGDTAKEVGNAIKNTAEIGVLSQVRGIDEAVTAKGVVDIQRRRIAERRARAARRARQNPATEEPLVAATQEAEETVTRQGGLFIQGSRVGPGGNRFTSAALAPSVTASGTNQTINNSEVRVDIGSITLETKEPVDTDEAARMLAEEIERKIKTGQVAPFSNGPSLRR